MRQATRANYRDRYRRGCLVELPARGELLVTGDLHGHKRNFDRIVEIADLAAHPSRHVILQEVIHQMGSWKRDRDMSFVVLEKVASLKAQFPDQVHVLMGNHELAELQGRVLYKDGRMLNSLFDRGILASYGADGRQVKESYKRFFRSMALGAVTRTNIFMCHSIPEERFVREFDRSFFVEDFATLYRSRRQLVEELVWGRDFSSELAETFARQIDAEVLIIGHEPCDEGHHVPNPRTVILDSKDERGCCCWLRLNQPYSQKGVVKNIKRLNPP